MAHGSASGVRARPEGAGASSAGVGGMDESLRRASRLGQRPSAYFEALPDLEQEAQDAGERKYGFRWPCSLASSFVLPWLASARCTSYFEP
jgi:hypothetical protein